MSDSDEPIVGLVQTAWLEEDVAKGSLKMSSPDEPAGGAASLKTSLPKEQTRAPTELCLTQAAPGTVDLSPPKKMPLSGSSTVQQSAVSSQLMEEESSGSQESDGSERPLSPVFSVMSMKSDMSMKEPLTFQGQEKPRVMLAGQVQCDVSGCPNPAVKACLTCRASYCQACIRPHYCDQELERHQLQDLPNQGRCEQHNRELEFHCRTDQSAICSRCLLHNHKGHDVSEHEETDTDQILTQQRRVTKKGGVPPPGPIQFPSVQPNSVTVSWSPPEGAPGSCRYRLTWSRGKEPHISVTVERLKMEVTGLWPGETYQFTVATLTEDGHQSTCVERSVQTEIPAPDHFCVDLQSTQASVRWKKPPGVDKVYFLLDLLRQKECIRTVHTHSTEFLLSDLQLGIEHTVSVSTVLERGGQSKPVSQRFTIDIPVPERLTVNSITTSSASLRWEVSTEMKHIPHSFLISYQSEGTEPYSMSTESCSADITGLKPGTLYTLRVYTELQHGGKSQPSAAVQMKTKTQLLRIWTDAMSSNEEKAGFATTAGNAGKNDGPPSDEDIRALFTRLDLRREITVADFLKITSHSVENHVRSTEKQLAEKFLQRLLTINYNARCISVKKKSTLLVGTKQDQFQTQDNTGFGALFKKTNQTEGTTSAQIHPMDVQMAVFHHADHFLKQLIVTKLSQCQYALPLLVPNPFTKEIEFPLWTFQPIKKSWKIREEQPKKTTESSSQRTAKQPDKIISKSQSVCKIETPMVSFFRLSSDSSSKSQLMNSLINEKHNTFFHRNCPGSSRTRLLMDGVVEIAWFCPSGEPTDKFNDCVAFCNIHGDATCYPIQRRIVTEMATINVVFLSEQDGNSEQNSDILQDLFKSPTPLICIFTDDENPIAETMEGKYKLGIKGRNQADVSEEVSASIKKCLSKQIEKFCKPKLYFTMKDLHLRSVHEGIKVDIESLECIQGQSAALEMMVLLTGKDPLKVKEEFLPCQGKLWHDWSQKNKKLYRLSGENLRDDQSAKHKEMREIRSMQKEYGLSKLMEVFVKHLIELSDTGKKYLLKWVGSLLDDFTSETVCKLHHEYDVKWNQMLDLKKLKSEHWISAQKEVEEILSQLSAATFGLEHFLREMGQVFEATERKGMSWHLPKMAAELMISGHPIELMDGDAAHVPLVWVTAILDKLIEKVGDKRVFVLSFLGIQSSGKSTMLNAMFGLQFAVSAGRCTRGAFMQMVEVSEEMKELLKVDYILVVDTKGLKGLELAGTATVFHDNELATFVVGLGNMALINIFGENVAEMQDILQIVVQAFLRMKLVNLKPSCIFVHQNVTDITAGEKNKERRRQLQNKLDEMTKLAAKEEVCDAECFSDVIAFDVKNDVKYFAHLWEGSPPMAPPNPSYSENIQDLKKTILSCVSKSNVLKLTEFKQRIETLWNALLKEDFVFSFKNTQEISVYRSLKEEYGKWTWSLRSKMQEIEDKLQLAITNKKVVKIDTKLLEDEIKVVFEKVKEEMKQFFENNKAKDILIQWKTNNEIRIVELHDGLVKKTEIKLNNVVVQINACNKLDEEKKAQETKLLKKSKELALVLREKGNYEEKMKAEFDSMWTQWVTNLTTDLFPTKDINIRNDLITILSEIHEHRMVEERNDCELYKSIQHVPDYIIYVTLNRGLAGRVKGALFGNHLTPEDQSSIRELISDIIRKTDSLVISKPVSTKGYNISFMQEIANFVRKSVREYKPIATKFEFKKEFTVDLSLYVCHRAADIFVRLHQTYKEATDPHIYLEKKKPEYYKVFQQYCTGAN